MIRFQEIRIDAVYLTSDDTASGVDYISEVRGLTPLRRTNRFLNSGEAIDGTPKQQVRNHKGRIIDVLIPLIPSSKYNALITAINSTDAADQNHAVLFTGDKGTFSLTCKLDDIDDSGEMQDSGHRDLGLRFRIATVVSVSA